ncbi:GGDEF domain-containing protein [Thermodesulfobacteriota bacterium]
MTDKGPKDTEQTLPFDKSKMAELLFQAKSMEKKACFVILGGLDVGAVLNINRSVMVIGRDSDCDLVLRDYDISRRHAEIRREGSNNLVIRDLGSTNGIFIGGELVEEVTIGEGDKVLLGRQTVFKFVLMDELEETCQKQIFESSIRDALTGIFNRKYFIEKISSDISFAKRHQIPLCLMIIDVDHFKKVNDNYGHNTGDYVLTQVAQIINDSIRDDDIVARYGGEEFVVIAQGIDFEGGKALAERIRGRIEEAPLNALDTTGTELRVTISIGVASISTEAKVDEDIMISTADQNLYHAKEKGRNRVVASEIT